MVLRRLTPPHRRLTPPHLTASFSCLWPRGAPSPLGEGDRDRNGQISPCGPPFPFSLFSSFCSVLIGTRRATTSTFCFLAFFSGLVQKGFAGAQGWLESLVVYLPFDSEIESYCRWRDLQFIKAPSYGEPQNPNRMASDAMDYPIRLPCCLLVWEFGFKPFIYLDISSSCCSCDLRDYNQA
uniref:Uncharacterized protein n=1 Tax=Fagus sylvatica TaxID=28930 RepID=A0A2N9F2P2_FAGSY